MKPDCVVVGSGLAGSVLAREVAEKQGKQVLVLEKRTHIAGNLYDETDHRGILVQRYGPHTFHTNEEKAYRYLARFGKLMPYRLTYEAEVRNRLVPCPFNFNSIELLYEPDHARRLIRLLGAAYPRKQAVPVQALMNHEEPLIREYAHLLFEEDYRPYTAKQWGLPPEAVDPAVLARVPVWLNRNNTYFDDRYQCLPREGYTRLMETMLRHPRIQVQTGCDALTELSFAKDRVLFAGAAVARVIFTGSVDALFGYRFGRLPYRSLHFEYEHVPVKSYQKAAITAYPKHPGYTRITEYTKLPPQKVGTYTLIAREYPLPCDPEGDRGREPYYPVNTPENQRLYHRYRQLAAGYANLTLCGRLAMYRYDNMDQIILRALEAAEALEQQERVCGFGEED